MKISLACCPLIIYLQSTVTHFDEFSCFFEELSLAPLINYFAFCPQYRLGLVTVSFIGFLCTNLKGCCSADCLIAALNFIMDKNEISEASVSISKAKSVRQFDEFSPAQTALFSG